MFESVLVANRGEIAVRIIRTLRRLGIRAIAVYAEHDAGEPHVEFADEAHVLEVWPGPETVEHAQEIVAEAHRRLVRGILPPYAVVESIVEAAVRSGAQAVHPGYGFLSERSELARACAAAGVAFVGPPPAAIELLGDKVAARRLAERLAIPTLPGIERPGLSEEEIVAWAAADPGRLPLVVKPAAGGGGRGMQVVGSLDELAAALRTSRRIARDGYGDETLLAERYLEPARHVEIQFLADAHGAAVQLGERECSLQRGHQKLVEEAPSPAVGDPLRARMGEAALALARAAGYVGAGTCEFLVPAGGEGGDGDFFFLEVNARLQVEHPITELVLGLDLVEAQLRVAAGERLWLKQGDLVARGHAIEARVCAEDPARRFLPTRGRIVAYREPAALGVRIDSGVRAGSRMPAFYDTLLCKVVAHAPTRDEALARLDRALASLVILGPSTNTAFLRRLLSDPAVRAGELDTGLVERLPAEEPDRRRDEEAAIAAALAIAHETPAGDDPWERLRGWRFDGRGRQVWRLVPEPGGDPMEIVLAGERVQVDGGAARHVSAAARADEIAVELDGRRRVWAWARDGALVRVGIEGRAWAFVDEPRAPRRAAAERDGALQAPLPGSVLDVRVRDGDSVSAGDVLVVLESMKMQLEVVAPAGGTVEAVRVAPGDRVPEGEVLVSLGRYDP